MSSHSSVKTIDKVRAKLLDRRFDVDDLKETGVERQCYRIPILGFLHCDDYDTYTALLNNKKSKISFDGTGKIKLIQRKNDM